MTSESQTPQLADPAAQHAIELQQRRIIGQDWLVAEFVNMANRLDLGIDITLQVGGIMVSGMLIGGKTYFTELAKSLENANGEPVVNKTLSDFILGHANIYEMNPDDPVDTPGYIHLSNARFFTPGGAPKSSEGVLWRGRIAEISGFFLGSWEE